MTDREVPVKSPGREAHAEGSVPPGPPRSRADRGSHPAVDGARPADALIAAAATTAGLSLWTRNRRDYPMPDLSFHGPP
jgi:hypothetical protein